MKNLILKWLGINPWMLNMKDIEDCMLRVLIQRYDIEGMSSKLDDMEYSLEDLESRGNDWDDMRDQLENIDFDKVQELDDRLTELLAGYKLEVKLTQENY